MTMREPGVRCCHPEVALRAARFQCDPVLLRPLYSPSQNGRLMPGKRRMAVEVTSGGLRHPNKQKAPAFFFVIFFILRFGLGASRQSPQTFTAASHDEAQVRLLHKTTAAIAVAISPPRVCRTCRRAPACHGDISVAVANFLAKAYRVEVNSLSLATRL